MSAPYDLTWLFVLAIGWVLWSFSQGARHGAGSALKAGGQALLVVAICYSLFNWLFSIMRQ